MNICHFLFYLAAVYLNCPVLLQMLLTSRAVLQTSWCILPPSEVRVMVKLSDPQEYYSFFIYYKCFCGTLLKWNIRHKLFSWTFVLCPCSHVTRFLLQYQIINLLRTQELLKGFQINNLKAILDLSFGSFKTVSCLDTHFIWRTWNPLHWCAKHSLEEELKYRSSDFPTIPAFTLQCSHNQNKTK